MKIRSLLMLCVCFTLCMMVPIKNSYSRDNKHKIEVLKDQVNIASINQDAVVKVVPNLIRVCKVYNSYDLLGEAIIQRQTFKQAHYFTSYSTKYNRFINNTYNKLNKKFIRTKKISKTVSPYSLLE